MKRIILWLLTPIQKILQRIGRQEAKISAEQVNVIVALAKPGDIFLSFEYGRPTSFLIKGFYDHAAILSSKLTIVEAVGDYHGGVKEVDLKEWLYKKDSVAVVRPLFTSNYVNEMAAANSLSFVGKKYDYQFKLDNEVLYCSEVPYVCYRMENKNFMSCITEDDEILPNDYYELGLNSMDFELVAEVKNAK